LGFQWGDLLSGVAIVLVLEGLLPFLNPGVARRIYLQMANLAPRELRIAGFCCMMAGLLLHFFARSGN